MLFNATINTILEQTLDSQYFDIDQNQTPDDYELKWIKLSDISGWNIPLNKSLPRNEINSEIIKQNIADIKSGIKLLPIMVSARKNVNKYFIDDGSHRIESLRRLRIDPETIIPVYVHYLNL